MDKENVLQLIKNQRESLQTSELKYYKNRIKALKTLKQNIITLKSEIFDALKQDLNKSEEESYMTEVGIVLSEISYMIKHCKSFSRIKRVRTPLSHFPATSFKIPCAYGSVLIMSPWNYPFMLSIEPLVDAITAGNSVVLKPSNSSPNVSKIIDKLIKMTFKPEYAFVVIGDRQECDFLLDQEFDYIFYTGSTRIGKMVMQKASEHFTPVTLELGGKSPCIVDETANIEITARRIVFGKFLNSGQTCVAPDYVYCQASIKDKLIYEIKRQIVLQYSVSPLTNPNYPHMINERQFDRVIGYINENNLVFGGKSSTQTLKIEPTIVNATFDDEVMQEEIFGPVLPIVTFDNLDQAVKQINARPKPLALYVFSSSKKNQDKVLSSCDFGGGCVNDTIMHIASSHFGFGGVKQSGMGAYHGKTGFDTFTHYKSIVNKKNWLDLPMRYQPMNKFKYWLVKMFLK